MSTRVERNSLIEEYENDFRDATGIYLTMFNGINVEKITQFRVNLRKQGAKYKVVKNTLARIALERVGKTDLIPMFKGPVGVVVTNGESVAPARVIRDFNKEYKDAMGVKSALVDGSVFTASQTMLLADLPSRDVLLSQLLSCLKAPMGNLAGALGGITTKLVGTLESVKKQKEEAGA